MPRLKLTIMSVRTVNMILVIFLSLFIFTETVFGTEYPKSMYVHSVKAPVYKKPLLNSEKLAELEAGSKLIVSEEKGYWYRITCKEYSGWVFKLMVRDEPPKEYRQIKADQIKALEATARRRPSAYTTTAAARGLTDKRRRFAARYENDYSALEKMEAGRISYDEANRFIKQGILYETME